MTKLFNIGHVMGLQFNFFEQEEGRTSGNLPEGLHYRPELINPSDEDALVERIRELPFREFEFHGYLGKRRVVSFGWHYDFSGQKLRKADDIPDFLLELRTLAARLADLKPVEFQHVLVTEYSPGAGIGWHRDKAVFGRVVGVSLLAPCILRFRRKAGEKWERANVPIEPRSAYVLTGPARSDGSTASRALMNCVTQSPSAICSRNSLAPFPPAAPPDVRRGSAPPFNLKSFRSKYSTFRNELEK